MACALHALVRHMNDSQMYRETMPNLPTIRPKFCNPPLVEQAVTVSFDPIQGFNLCDFGLFWAKIRDKFSVSETAPRIETAVENFSDGEDVDIGISFMPLLLPRAFYRDEAGDIVQLQNDRFTFNWVKIEGRDYPHFDETFRHFVELFATFLEYVAERDFIAPNITQAELTNLNIIEGAEFGDDFAKIGEIFRVDPLDMSASFLVNETYTRTRQHRMVKADGTAIGRLHSVISPVFNPVLRKKAYKFELTARSAQNLNSMIGVEDFYADARSAINAAFLATVQPSMRQKWGEKDD